MRSASIFFNCPARPDSPRIDSASLFSTWASNWSISSTGNGYGAFCFLGFLVVITSVMEFPFRYYFMTSLHTENLTGSGGEGAPYASPPAPNVPAAYWPEPD